MNIEKIKTISCKCKKCGTVISMRISTNDDVELLKSKKNMKCPTCDNQLTPYMDTLINAVANYNNALVELESALSSTNATPNM